MPPIPHHRIPAPAAVCLIAVFLAVGPHASRAQDAETVASYPHGTFLENLDAGSDGTLLFTSYLDRRLLRWSETGMPVVAAELDVHPVGVLVRPDDIILSAHGTSFTAGAAFTASNQLLVLDPSGSVLRRTPAPEALFLNGLVELSPDTVLIADSLAGRIWRFDPATGALAPWLDDPLLAPDPVANDARPGANGLKRAGDWLYVSNSSRGALYRVGIAENLPQGPLETVALTGPIDDFALLPNGSIAAATHGDRLIRIAPDGGVSDILADGCDACTSVAPFGPDGALIVLTTGNLLEGGDAPARVLRVPAQN